MAKLCTLVDRLDARLAAPAEASPRHFARASEGARYRRGGRDQSSGFLGYDDSAPEQGYPTRHSAPESRHAPERSGYGRGHRFKNKLWYDTCHLVLLSVALA